MGRDKQVTSKWKRSERRRLRRCVECDRQFPSTDPSNRTCSTCLKREAEARARPYSLDSERREMLGEFVEDFEDPFVGRYRQNEEARNRERAQRQKKISERKLKSDGGS